MEDGRENIHNFYIFLLLISLILLIADFIELWQLIVQWKIGLKMDVKVFYECIQFQLFFKTSFCFFNLSVSFITLVLVGFLIKNSDFLIDKMLPAIMEVFAIIFGPYLFSLCILGIYYWDKTVYTCDKYHINTKKFIGTNCFNIIFFTILSGIITFYKCISSSFYHIAFSITKPDYRDRSTVIKKFFWHFVFKYIRREEVVRHALGMNNQPR
jgi:hypothetical protein